MKLYKHNSLSFTLITHDRRQYHISSQGPIWVSQYLGKVDSHAIINGTLLKQIPDFLKRKCFTLNTKNYESTTK